MNKFKYLLICLIASFSISYVAEAKGRPYGMAGCGLWTLVIKDKGMGPQLGVWALRLLLNVQTFAITSGTSNCVHGRGGHAMNEKQMYVAANLSELSKEAAQGEGKHLNGLASLMGCTDHKAFANMSKRHYSQIFETHDPEIVLGKYLNEVQASEGLAKNCTI